MPSSRRADSSNTSAPAPSRAGRWCWLGRRPYDPVAALQERLREEVFTGGAETLVLVEHDPVITLGRSAAPENVLVEPERLEAMGVALRHTRRGGDVTYHGPGQLVGYPVFRLDKGVVAHVTSMAEAILALLEGLGVKAEFRRSEPGIWVGNDKVCAFGVHVRRRVAIHGFALNVATALDAYALIVPCGLEDKGVTSLAALTGRAVPLTTLLSRLVVAFETAYGMSLHEVSADVVAGS